MHHSKCRLEHILSTFNDLQYVVHYLAVICTATEVATFFSIFFHLVQLSQLNKIEELEEASWTGFWEMISSHW